MKKLRIELENCYGISKLVADLDFTGQRAYAIYAPNGAMKSSLAQTFKDVADNAPSKDRVFPRRATTRSIADESGAQLPPESVLVIRSYDEFFGHTEKTSTLLVDAKLRSEHEQLHVDIDKAKAALLKALKTQSGSKKDIEKELSLTFTKGEDKFFVALLRLEDEVQEQKDAPFADIVYDRVFDEKVMALLETKDFKTAIADYVKKYNELLDASVYFKRGTFNYYNAAQVAKSLADNGFFDAEHTVILKADSQVEITSQGQLEDLVAKEKEAISNDATLRKKYAEIEKLITKNQNVRDFQAYLSEHDELLPELANIDNLREEIWKSYLKACEELYQDATDKYRAAEKRKKEIEDEAAKQRTQWEAVIDIFNRRFFVPFRLTPKNKMEVVVGKESMLTLGFLFQDRDEEAEVDRNSLLQVLSSGEKKALYILNVIFEIEARKKAKQETVFVIDDIADSFDYKNKYAIIQYLKDIEEETNFSQIILTHNFDFFRTLQSRFVSYKHCLMALKNAREVTFTGATGIQNPFVKDWKLHFFTDSKKRIASIPFMRNLVEYTRGDQDPTFGLLTSLLHWKEDSAAITQSDLDAVYALIFQGGGAWPDGACSVIDCITEEAASCLVADHGVNFENKIVLSIAIRIAAERFMVDKINDVAFVAGIASHQTRALFDKYQSLPTADPATVETLQSVLLMTPENIHLNSFMYEPILDMSDEHLRQLYSEVTALDGELPTPGDGQVAA